MNATSKTLTFACVAAVSVLTAWGTWYANQPSTVEGFADVGQPFFEDFSDPLKAAALKVSVFNDDTSEPESFSVRQNDDGLWVIPSHHDYPAEAADRLARTATSFIGLTRAAVQSRSKEDWGSYGVVDPLDTGLDDAEARGTRVTLSDGSGNPLVDLIVGKPVPGQENTYYVREPEKNTTYLAELDVDLSAKFSDWIEPDLLKISQNDIVRMVKDNYSVDEVRGAILKGEVLEFEKEGLESTGTWTLKGLDDATEEIVPSPVNALARNLDQLKIVGIRPKPEGLNADLTVSPDVARNPLVRQILEADMQKQGFYIAANAQGQEMLVSNEGELIVGTEDGVEYTLYFGEIARGSARDLEVGFAAEDGDSDAESTDKDDADGSESSDDDSDAADPPDLTSDDDEGPRRYLLIKVEFDESLLGPKPVAPVEPEMPEILKESESDGSKPDGAADDPAATPDASDPPAGDAAPAEPSASESGDTPSPDTPPSGDAPSGDAPSADDPSTDDPSTDDPSNANAGDPAPADDPAPATDPAPEQDPTPAGDSPPADDPATPDDACFIDEPAADPQDQDPQPPADPADDPPASGDPAPAGEPSSDEPSADAPASDTPTGDTPTGDAPDAPAAGQDAPTADTPAAGDAPAQESQDPPAGDESPDRAAADPPAEGGTPAGEAAAGGATDEQPPAEPVDPKQAAQQAYDQAKGEYEAARRAFETDLADWERREEEGREKAEELATRFANWYYVISAESFDKFRVARTDVVKKKEADDSESGETPGAPSIPGLPPGTLPPSFDQ